MKKLMIRSEDEKEDKQAAIQITQAMMKNDVRQIVWYSSIGQKVTEMKGAIQVMLKHAKWMEAINKRLAEAECKISDQKFKILRLEEVLQELTNRVAVVCPKKKKGARDAKDDAA